ncbi:hypothetical protein FQN53_000965 [Emmonsiellopsis sp. PD_33]|nr:hypothetical protein FQN53_000965 [Emmonsiellopsis sp. PD_33]KAK2805426.1 hypothetical protein FQN51_000252 [Onygenales sp. PD_10]
MGSFEELPTTTTSNPLQCHPKQKTKQQPKPWRETPLIESEQLSKLAGCRVFLKLESTQPSGSFKSRGIGNLILSHTTNPSNTTKDLHFFIPSGGNAGLAAVTAARSLNYPCTVVVPAATKRGMQARLVEAGAAAVVAHGETIEVAAAYMREVVMEGVRGKVGRGGREVVGVELHPYEGERVWEGNSTLVDEVVRQMAELEGEEGGRGFPADAVVCSVGGGGLMNGVVQGIERAVKHGNGNGGKDVHVLALETRGADALARAVEAGKLVAMPAITSMASSLGAVTVSRRSLDYVLHPPEGIKVHNFVMDDSEAARGVLRLLDEHRLLVELACGICVEAVVEDKKRMENNVVSGLSKLAQVIPDFGPESRVVVVACGGSNISLEIAAEYRERLANGWD